MRKKSGIKIILCAVLISILILVVGFTYEKDKGQVRDIYQVYLNGKMVGLLENDEELYALINKEQQAIKAKYGVEKIYPPKGLEVSLISTYDTNLLSSIEIYNKIKENGTFTIEGYQVTIKSSDEKVEPIEFTILEEKTLDESIKNITNSFLGEENYTNYLNSTQEKIEDGETGTTIEKVYLNQSVLIKKTLISTEDYIFTNSDDLTKFLLFGTLKDAKQYKVKLGDTIENVADRNELNTEELLIANPQLVSENALLYAGQELNISLINPQLDIVEEITVAENQKIKYETVVQYDKSLQAGINYVKQQGSDGLAHVVYKKKVVNGEVISVVEVSSTEITPVINKIIVVGGSTFVYTGDAGYWAWPTMKPYSITSRFKWRWGKMHNGIDITYKKNSPIYAIQGGKVTNSLYNSSMGNAVYVNHQNGYVSVYMHMTKRLVKKGDWVVKGQVLGLMGSTGFSTGTHLHIGISYKGKYIDPLSVLER